MPISTNSPSSRTTCRMKSPRRAWCPIGNLYTRLSRTVRDAAKAAGKPVDLVLEGAETELDNNIIQHISDPLIHLVRNAVAHGIEDAARAPPRGKSAQRPHHRPRLSPRQSHFHRSGRRRPRHRLRKRSPARRRVRRDVAGRRRPSSPSASCANSSSAPVFRRLPPRRSSRGAAWASTWCAPTSTR